MLGEVSVPRAALYGIHTARARANFPDSGRQLCDEPTLVAAFAHVKRAAAAANASLGQIETRHAQAIAAAAGELIAGEHRQWLTVDLMEGAGGTSLNMNINEVLANRALELLGRLPGEYSYLHPNDHVNRGQSTNDVVPSAILMACHEGLGHLADELATLAAAFHDKQEQFKDQLRLGRTCLQDAQPMMLGDAFGAFASLSRRLSGAVRARMRDCLELPLGATAIGTGLGASPGYRGRAIEALREATGHEWRSAPDLFDALANADVYARLSAELRGVAIALGKVAGDLILLSSGPDGGIAELRLPAVQAGSSIMPGKVNPVIPMSACQVGFAVVGYDAIVAMACQQGQLEINAYEPVIATHLLASLRLVRNTVAQLAKRCVRGIEVNEQRASDLLLKSSAVASALLPRLGYEAATRLVREAQSRGVSFLDIADEQGVLRREEALALIRASAKGAA
jgi:aspartate ammonia-lyase